VEFAEFIKLVGEISDKTGGSDKKCEVLHQHDIFYKSPNGRLKLRTINSNNTTKSQLIFYKRSDQEGPKLSTYSISEVSDPKSMDTVLGDSLERLGEVVKTRYLYLVGQTRIHVDRVDGLGDFMELEVVLRPDQTIEEGEKIAEELKKSLKVKNEHLLTGAYMDMILAKN